MFGAWKPRRAHILQELLTQVDDVPTLEDFRPSSRRADLIRALPEASTCWYALLPSSASMSNDQQGDGAARPHGTASDLLVPNRGVRINSHSPKFPMSQVADSLTLDFWTLDLGILEKKMFRLKKQKPNLAPDFGDCISRLASPEKIGSGRRRSDNRTINYRTFKPSGGSLRAHLACADWMPR